MLQTSGSSPRLLLPYVEKSHPDSRSLTTLIDLFSHFHDNLSNVLNFFSVGCQANTFLALSENSLFKMPHIAKAMIQHTLLERIQPISCSARNEFSLLLYCHAVFPESEACVSSVPSFSYVYYDFCFCKTGRCLTKFLWEEARPSKQNNDLKVLGSIFSSSVD